MLSRKIIFAFCLICFVSSGSRAQQPPRSKPATAASRAQQPVPPPKPTGDGPSLEATMKFIQDKLSDIGQLTYSVSIRYVGRDTVDPPFIHTFEVSNVVANPQRCTISFHCHETIDQFSKPLDSDQILNLKEAKKITVQSAEQLSNEFSNDSVKGQPFFTYRPSIFLLWVTYNGNSGSRTLLLDDEELTNRLARAIAHAVELCTPEKQSEPF